MVKPKQLSNNKKVLQEQVVRLNNEIEELRLEREESKKNVLHFMQEADGTRKELEKTQALLDELSSCPMGLQSPPPEQQVSKPKISDLISKLSVLDDSKLNELFQLLAQPDLKQQLEETKHQVKVQIMENLALQEELEQTKQEYKATRAALQIENERAEIIEKRWKESESSLEHTESIIQSLNQDLNYLRQQQQECNTIPLLEKSLPNILENQTLEQLNLTLVDLEQKEVELKEWKEKYSSLFENYVSGGLIVYGKWLIRSYFRHTWKINKRNSKR